MMKVKNIKNDIFIALTKMGVGTGVNKECCNNVNKPIETKFVCKCFEIQQKDYPVELKNAQQGVIDSEISLIYLPPDLNI